VLDDGAAAQFGPLEQDAHGGRESGVRNLLLRLPGDSRLGHSDTHVHARHAAEQFVEVLQFGRTARQHDAVGQFPGVSRILDLLLHELRDVRGAGLDHRGQVAQQNVLRLAGRTAVDADQLVLGSQFAEPYFCLRLSTCFSGTLIVRMSRLMADAPIGIEAT